MEITLGEAIELQGRVAVELAQIKSSIISSKDEEERDRLLDRYEELSNNLIELKTDIRKANITNDISKDIYRKDELRLMERIYRYIGRIEDADKIKKNLASTERKIKVANCFTKIKVNPSIKIFTNVK